MIEINNRRICEYCFTEISSTGSVCPGCGGAEKLKNYRGTLTCGSILAGKYMIGRVLGKGGFGITYQCYDLLKNRIVAIKEYMPDALAYRTTESCKVIPYDGEKKSAYESGAAKFLSEAKLVSKFNGNPNITSVYEFFCENNTSYYVMEYLDGKDLKKYIAQRGGKISESDTLKVISSVSMALADVHSAKVLHRDISPDNIFICRNGVIKLIDFGAARQLVSEVSNSLSVILKHGFAPLEQYKKKGKQGPWTDIYALGATAYYCITGKMLPEATSRLDNKSVNMRGISPGFAAVISKMTAFEIENRYGNIKQLQKALASVEPKKQSESSQKISVKVFDEKELSKKSVSKKDNAEKSFSGMAESFGNSGKRTVYKCRKCGKIVRRENMLCAACGKDLASNEGGGAYSKKSDVDLDSGQKTAVYIALTAGAIMVILLLLALYFAFFYEKSYKPINRYELKNTLVTAAKILKNIT